MLALTDPHEAYRRSQFDAFIHGAKPADLVVFCLGQVSDSVGGAIAAHRIGNPTRRSEALTRALTALTALEMGVNRDAPMAEPLLQFYGAAKVELLDCVSSFDSERLTTLRTDFAEMRDAFAKAAPLS